MQPSKPSVPVPDPTLLTTAALTLSIANLKELLENKIENNFQMDIQRYEEVKRMVAVIENRHAEYKIDTSEALHAALEAQKALVDQQNRCNEESSEKLERATSKELEALRKESMLSRELFSGYIRDLKERLDRGAGKENQQGVQREQQGWMIPMIVLAALYLLNLIFNVIQFVPHLFVK